MNKEVRDIPLWTWYNGQFLFQFADELQNNPNKTISEFFDNFLVSQEGLKKINIYHTKNQGTIINLLFGLLVIPKEIWEKNTTSFLFKTRHKFVIKPPTDNNIDTLNFLRQLRNSVVHANFSLDFSNKRWLFWNYQNNKSRNFLVEITHINLGNFIEEIGKYYLNEVRRKST